MKNPTYMSLFGPTGLLILKKKIQPTWLFGPTRLFGTLEYPDLEACLLAKVIYSNVQYMITLILWGYQMDDTETQSLRIWCANLFYTWLLWILKQLALQIEELERLSSI